MKQLLGIPCYKSLDLAALSNKLLHFCRTELENDQDKKKNEVKVMLYQFIGRIVKVHF